MTPVELLAAQLRQPDPELGRCLLLVSEALGNAGAVDRGLIALDRLAGDVPAPTVDAVLRHLFVTEGFAGDSEDYHSEDNSFLDRVLERRLGMPITLSAVLIEVGRRLDLELQGVGLPGHFLVGVETAGEPIFVDAFAGGVLLDRNGATDRFQRLFGSEVELDPAMLAPVGTPAIVGRVLNNLVRTYSERDRGRLDPLLDVRVALPGPPAERMLLVRLAESRGRWDLAARLREELDPEDPEAKGLRSRLN